MKNTQQRISRGIDIFKSNLLLFIFICLISSIVSIYLIPIMLNGLITEQSINEALYQVGITYGGAITFSVDEIMNSISSLFKLSILSTILVIFAYIVKYKIDKNIFRFNSWRDWKFALYISGSSLLIVDIFQKININSGDNIIINIILTILSCFTIIVFSSIILPEEREPIKIN
jgi:hypothetical protein